MSAIGDIVGFFFGGWTGPLTTWFSFCWLYSGINRRSGRKES